MVPSASPERHCGAQGVRGDSKDVPGNAWEPPNVVLGCPGDPLLALKDSIEIDVEMGSPKVDVFVAHGNENTFLTNAVK